MVFLRGLIMLCNEKYLTKYLTFKTGIWLLPISVFADFCVCILVALNLSEEVETSVQVLDMFKDAGIFMLYSFYVPVILVIAYIIYNSGYVVFKFSNVEYYRFFFSKKVFKIEYDDINVLLANGFFKKNENSKPVFAYGILLLDCNNEIIKRFENNPKLVLRLYNELGEDNIKVIKVVRKGYIGNYDCNGPLSEMCKPVTLDDFFSIDFSELTDKQRLLFFKYYCNPSKGNPVNGEELLKKRGLL